MAQPPELNYKLVVLGNTNVGKTCLVHRFANEMFLDSSQPTIGANFITKKLTIGGTYYRFEVWDTAGQEKYRSLTPMYYKGAAAALIIYDVSSAASLEGAREWIKELHEHAPPSVVIGLVGNKIDLNREISKEAASQLAQRYSLIHSEVSAKTGEGVEETFLNIAQRLPKSAANKKKQGLKLEEPKSNSYCC
jgi:Ras-related protein Rab-5C